MILDSKEKKISSNWIISQYWSELLFINYSCSPEMIQKRLPKGLTVDTYNNQAFLSIVPFKMSKVRLPFSPSLPFSKLNELNIRTYVKFKEKIGIYFFTLDTDHWLASIIARKFFSLPYRFKQMKLNRLNDDYNFSSDSFQLQAKMTNTIVDTDFSRWICERYSLFTEKNQSLYQGIARHTPWKISDIKIEKMTGDFLKSFSLEPTLYHNAFAGDPLTVSFRPFLKLKF